MKKLSILLALILTCNIFATTTFAANEAVDYEIIESFDFNNATGTTLDAKLAPSSSYTCAGYEKVDDEHGLSIVMSDSSKIRYNFDDAVDGEVKISFDLYPKGTPKKFWVTSATKAGDTGGNACYIYATSDTYYCNWWGTAADLGIKNGEWNEVEMVVSDIRGTKPYVKYYVNGTLVKEGGYATSADAATNGYIIFGGGGVAGSEMLLDNIKFEREKAPVLNSFDFNSSEGTNLPTGLTAKTNYAAAYEKVDSAYGNSFALSTNKGFTYVFPQNVGDTVTISFEVMKKSGSPTMHVVNDTSGTNIGNGASLFSYATGTMDFAWWAGGQLTYSTPGRWYQVDLVITNTESGSTVKEYVNGWLARTNTTLGTMSAVGFVGRTADKIYMDNLVVRGGEYVTKYAGLKESYSFDDFPNGSGYAGTGYASYATLPVGFTRGGAQNAGSYVKYVAVDEDHGNSLGFIGDISAYYKVQEQLQNKSAVLSFDISVNDITNGGSFYVKSGQYYVNNNLWGSDALVIVNKNTLTFGGGQTYTLEKDKWVRVDLLMTPKDATTANVDCFINGIKLNTTSASRTGLTDICFWSKGRQATTYIDNLQFEVPATTGTFSALSGKTTYVPEIDENILTVKFDKTVNRDTFDDSLISVAADGEPVQISHINWNYAATSAEIVLEENLVYGSEYTITFPDAVTSVFGDTLATTALTVNTTTKLDDFEDFNDSEITGRITFPSSTANAGIVADGVITMSGESNSGNWCEFYYNMPYTVSDGVVKVSFDHYLEGNDTTGGSTDAPNKTAAWFRPKGTGTISSTAGLYWLEAAAGVNIVPQLDWVSTELTGWKNQTWHHYDFIFDLDGKTFKMYMDGALAEVAETEYMETLTQLAFNAGLGTVKVDNLSVRYYDSLGKFETDLSDEVDCTKETINVSFEDAVDVNSLNEYFVIKNSKGQVADFEITEATLYGATVAMYEMVVGETYTLSLGDTTTLVGDKYANSDVTFKAVEKFEVTDAKILDGTTALTSAAEWDAEKEYTLSIDVKNSTATEKTIYVIVAGYNGEALVYAKVVPVDISNSRTYTMPLGAVDMKNATQIKIFAFNNFEDLAPIMTPAVEF